MSSGPRPKGVCASGHPAVTRAALQTIEAGGNAFDAAVTAGFASAHCEPALTSLGGGGFLLARTAAGDDVLFDFFVDTPGLGTDPKDRPEPDFTPVEIHFEGASQMFNIGLGSVGVPGTVAGLLHVHERLGRLPLDKVVAPAVKLAREGVKIEPMQAYTFKLLFPILTVCDEGKQMFAHDGRPRLAGGLFQNERMAAFLEGLPDTADALYGGWMAEQLEEEMKRAGGLLTRDDLASYKVVEREPLRVPYRGHTVLTNPMPALGGPMIALMLTLLEEAGEVPGPLKSPEHTVRLAAVMREADDLRSRGKTSVGELRGDGLAESIRRILLSRRKSTRGTTHLSIVDGEGNVASLTSSNGEGSGFYLCQTGIMLNNMLGEDDLHPTGFHKDPAGQRVASMMAPTVLLDEKGEVKLALGSGGSRRIRTAVTQVVSHVVDFGLPVEAAVKTPRVHFEDQKIHLEGGHDPQTAEALIEAGFMVNAWADRDLFFGGVHSAGPREAGPDPRRGGVASMLEP